MNNPPPPLPHPPLHHPTIATASTIPKTQAPFPVKPRSQIPPPPSPMDLAISKPGTTIRRSFAATTPGIPTSTGPSSHPPQPKPINIISLLFSRNPPTPTDQLPATPLLLRLHRAHLQSGGLLLSSEWASCWIPISEAPEPEKMGTRNDLRIGGLEPPCRPEKPTTAQIQTSDLLHRRRHLWTEHAVYLLVSTVSMIENLGRSLQSVFSDLSRTILLFAVNGARQGETPRCHSIPIRALDPAFLVLKFHGLIAADEDGSCSSSGSDPSPGLFGDLPLGGGTTSFIRSVASHLALLGFEHVYSDLLSRRCSAASPPTSPKLLTASSFLTEASPSKKPKEQKGPLTERQLGLLGLKQKPTEAAVDAELTAAQIPCTLPSDAASSDHHLPPCRHHPPA